MKFFRIKMNNKVSVVKGNHGKKGQIRRVSIPVHQGRSQDFSKEGGGGVTAGTPSGDRRLYMVYTTALPHVSAGSVILSGHEGPH